MSMYAVELQLKLKKLLRELDPSGYAWDRSSLLDYDQGSYDAWRMLLEELGQTKSWVYDDE